MSGTPFITEDDIRDLTLIDTAIDMFFEGDITAIKEVYDKYGKEKLAALLFARFKAKYQNKKLIAATMLRQTEFYDQSTF